MMKYALGLVSILCMTAPVLADEAGVRVPCGPMSDLRDAAKYRLLSHDEWIAARSFFFTAPDTPASFPPGDTAMILDLGDGSGTLIFVDGSDACAPMRIGKDGLAALRQIRDGVITHAAGRL